MASGSSSPSIGAELMMNTQQESNLVLPTPAAPSQHHHPIAPMKQSNEPGSSYPNADIVIEVSPTTLLDGNRYICHVCYKGFQREQNLTLHRRVHNLPFHLKTKAAKDAVVPRKVYLCPEPTCINHNRSHALGDFGGLKKHYLRKHCTDKKHKCDICSKTYAVASDLRAHLKTCYTKKYNCECGARFSSESKFSHHQDYCDAQVLEDATKDTTNSDMSNLLRSINNDNINSSISSTTSYLPPSYMGDNSSKSTTNINNNVFIGSTTSYTPISDMGSNNNNINNLITNSTMSELPMFNMGHRSVQSISNNSHIGFTTHLGPQPVGLNLASIPSNIFSFSSTQQNQHEFQGKPATGYYTNLMMGIEYNNVNPVNTIFMGDGSHYGSGEVTTLFSGSGMMFNNSSSRTSITSNMVHGFTGSSSSGVRGFSMYEENCIPFGTPNVVAKHDLYGSTSRNSSGMGKPYARFCSSGGGSILPQEHSFLFGSEHFNIAENNGFNDILNSLNNPETESGVASSIINENVRSGDYQGNYSGYVNGAGREVLNCGTLGATTGEVAPNEDQYWNEHGFWF